MLSRKRPNRRGGWGSVGEFRLASFMPPSYTHSFVEIGCASVAQRQSTGFVNRMLWVQIPSLASRVRPPSRGRDRTFCGTASDPSVGELAEDQAGRWPSGQWHQTVNLTDSVLRGFESLPAHSLDFRLMIFAFRKSGSEGGPSGTAYNRRSKTGTRK